MCAIRHFSAQMVARSKKPMAPTSGDAATIGEDKSEATIAAAAVIEPIGQSVSNSSGADPSGVLKKPQRFQTDDMHHPDTVQTNSQSCASPLVSV